MKTNTLVHEKQFNLNSELNKTEIISGFAFAGCWVGIALNSFGFISTDIATPVSLVLATAGAIIGVFVNKNTK